MNQKNEFSRRQFVKTGILSSTAIAGAATLASCSNNTEVWKKEEPFPVFKGSTFSPADGVAGLLFSQVGYEPGLPVRIIIRLPQKENLPADSQCVLIPSATEKEYSCSCKYWGEVWKSHWWVAQLEDIDKEGEWAVEIRNGDQVLMRDTGLKVQKNILWNSTIEWSSVDMLERRLHFTKVGAGWQDAGTLWVESPAQSAMIIAMAELLGKCPDRFEKGFIDRLNKQLTVGCDYLVMTQAKAHELGYAPGSMSHDLLGHEKDILPCDVLKAVTALLATSRVLPDTFKDKKKVYLKTAKLSYQWLTTIAKPLGDLGLSRFQRGLPKNAIIPKNEWQTRDLVSFCWASLELWKSNISEGKETAVKYTNQIIARQIPEGKAENGFYGHFYEYSSTTHSEKSWIHGIVDNHFGADIGGIYPNYLMPVIDMLKMWPNHEDAPKWKRALHNFIYGYLIPTCEQNPFFLVPQGIFGEEGPVWFCGTFHGTNTIYGYTAALALELAKLFDEPKLKKIAYGNLQWLAGLNAGITAENVKQGCVVFSTDIPEGVALPASMVCHIGNRWAGTWFQTRGVICNGFSTGKQFVYDVEPKKENDGPFSLTDEDWIPHSAGWLTGLMRL